MKTKEEKFVEIRKREVKIEWQDSCSCYNKWIPIEDMEEAEYELSTIITYGFLIIDNNDYIVVAQNYDKTSDSISHCMTIPKVNILNIKNLE